MFGSCQRCWQRTVLEPADKKLSMRPLRHQKYLACSKTNIRGRTEHCCEILLLQTGKTQQDEVRKGEMKKLSKQDSSKHQVNSRNFP